MATYFKNTELAARYNISEATVRNWIKATKDGKLKLELVERDGRVYVANSVSNIPVIENLIKQNRKYRNKLFAKTVTVSPTLFKFFNEAQVYDIVRNLELHHEIPRQYGYFGSGAREWDEYINKQARVDTPSLLRGTIELLADSYYYIDKCMTGFKRINVVDVGVGNALPIRDLLDHLIKEGKLGRYVALDFSEDMLGIAERNVRSWFGDSVPFEGYQLDITYERFANIIAEDHLRPENDTANLILFLGATPDNLRVPNDAFRTVCESMAPKDLLVYVARIELPAAIPEWLEHSYSVKPQRPELLTRHKFVLDQLNIKESYYTPEIGFDYQKGQNYSRVKLKVALTLRFEFGWGERTVYFEKGDSIILWRSWQITSHGLINLLEGNGFYVLNTSQTEDRDYMLTISQVQRI